MKHILLDPKTNKEYVDLTLYVEDVKILYNACVDILNEYPEMIGYKRTAKKLKMVLNDHEAQITNNPYMICNELEESLNRNQRDALDYYMIELNGREREGINNLLETLKYIIANYDGETRMSLEQLEDFFVDYI
jgi:hypothetical protein